MESKSLISIWSRGEGESLALSPVTHNTFRTPNAVAPMISLCKLPRDRFRADICRTGSASCSIAILLHAQDDMRGIAVILSVKFNAVTNGLIASMLRINLSVEEVDGGLISHVTTNSPATSLRCRSEAGSV